MTTPDPESDSDLLGDLKNVDDDSLANSAAKTEGLNGKPAVIPGYHHRHIKFFHITEHELSAISLVNAVATSMFSVGTAFLTFSLDLFKDTLLADNVPQAAQAALGYMQPASTGFGVIFYIIGGASLVWRYGFIDKIKQESLSSDRYSRFH